MSTLGAAEQSKSRGGPAASLLRGASAQLRSLARFRSLLRYLVSASLKTQNIGTVFGHVWWVLDPLLLMAVYVLVVDVMLNRGGPDYPVFVFTAVLSWKWFTSATQRSIAVTIGKEQLMKRVAFPRSILPLSSVIAATLHFGFGLVVLVVFAIAFGIYPHPALVFVPLVAAIQLALTLAVALFLSALNVFFRDIAHFTTYVFRLGFYLSPSLYSVSQVPEEYKTLYNLNPFATIFPAYRAGIIDHSAPDLLALAAVGGVSLILLLAAWTLFVRLEPYFTKIT